MKVITLTGRTVMIVHSYLEGAEPLQDRIVQSGGRVFTAYSLYRALLISKNVALDDALIDSDFEGAAEVEKILTDRRVPHCYFHSSAFNVFPPTMPCEIHGRQHIG